MKMSQNVKRAAHAYCRAVGSYCPRRFRKRLKRELNALLLDFVEAHPDVSSADVAAHFGAPGQFAADFIAHMDDENGAGFVRVRRCMNIVVASIIVVVVSALIVGAWGFLDRADQGTMGTYEEIVTDFGRGT